MRQLDALLGEGVHALGVGTAQDAAAVAAELAHAEVIDVKKQNVRFLSH
jgi:hypothetical protein